MKRKIISKNKKANSHFDFLFGNENLLKSKRSNSRPNFAIWNTNLSKSKRSQIGSTLTWFVGFLIIFFVMLLFLASTISLAARRKIGIDVTGGSSEVSESQRALLTALKVPIVYEQEITTVQQLIAKWASSEGEEKNKIKEKIKEEVEEKLDSLLGKDEGYIFYAAYSEKNKEIREGIYGGGFLQIDGADDYISLSKNFYMYGAAVEAKSALERAPTLYLLSNKKVKIKLYIGKTK